MLKKNDLLLPEMLTAVISARYGCGPSAVTDAAYMATLHTAKAILDELWNIWDAPDCLHEKIRELEALIKEMESEK